MVKLEMYAYLAHDGIPKHDLEPLLVDIGDAIQQYIRQRGYHTHMSILGGDIKPCEVIVEGHKP